MMNWSTLCYLFKEGIVGLWRNRTMAFASMGTIILCLVILGGSYILGSNVDYIIEQVQAKFGVTAYLKEDLEPAQIEALQKKIQASSQVKAVTYISKEEALKTFSEDNEDVNLFAMFKEDNPMPASLEITTYDMTQQSVLVTELKEYPEIDETVYFKNETQMFIQLRHIINCICYGILIALVVVGIMLMSNTIKLTVYVRRKEINIMKYVGATDTFIQLPFFIEGILIGLIGAGISILLIAGGYSWIVEKASIIQGVLQGITLLPSADIIPTLALLFTGLGAGIGCIGSRVAIRRHLKV